MASSMANIVFPGHFNPKRDKWCDYKDQIFCALDAAGVDISNLPKARSLFLSQCGKDMYALIASLLEPKRPTEVDFNHIIKVIDKFYDPDVNEILQAEKFHKRLQMQNESIQDFVVAIGQLGVKCNFVDLKRQLRDRLVLGVRDERLRRELLMTKDLAYENAVQTCLNHLASVQETYPDTNESQQNSQNTVVLMDIDRMKPSRCQHCSRIHPVGERCPFSKAKCCYCMKLGHISLVCKKKLYLVNQIDEIETDMPIKTEENMMGIYTCRPNDKPFMVEVFIEGVKLKMDVDSGASRTIISKEIFNRMWLSPPPLFTTKLQLVTWTKDIMDIKGIAFVRVQMGGKEGQCELVVASGTGPSVLGRDWFTILGIGIAGISWMEEKILPFKLEFPDLFENGLGTYKGPVVSLHVDESTVPRFLRAHLVPFPIKEQVNQELKEMMKQGILSPVKYSRWASPLIVVKKDDGSLRLCGDYRSTVNAAIDVDTYPWPTPAEIFVKLSGGRIFSKLDLKQAYTQLKVDDETAKLLTLNTPLGLMKMNRLAFGVNAAPVIFHRLMSTALADIDGVACLVDDIAVMGRNKKEHDLRIRTVLQKLQDMGLRLNLKKCIFATNLITFLDHQIDENGLHPSPIKVKEIQEKPAPVSKESLRGFLDLCNFYEKFLPDKETVLEPLFCLLDSKEEWSWTITEEEAFENAKSLLYSDLTLIEYELSRAVLLICDASEYGLGAVIAHVMDDGSERPIMMASRTMQEHEKQFGQIHKEALAIVYGLTKFHEFLSCRKFTIITDHRPLIQLFNPKKPIPVQISPWMLRWCLKLSCYSYSIVHRPGKAMGNANGLSQWNNYFTADLGAHLVKDVLLLEEQPGGWNLDAKIIASETKKDPLLLRVISCVLQGWPYSNIEQGLKPFWTRRHALSLYKDCLLWCNRVIIPTSLQQEVLQLLHAPHAGIVITKAVANGYVWWAGMDNEIQAVVAVCEQCQVARNNPRRESWSGCQVDFDGNFQGKDLVLTDG